MGLFLCFRNRTRQAAVTAKSPSKPGSRGIQIKERTAKETWKGKTRTLRESNHVNSKDAVDIITFYFQQNLPTPSLHHSEVFYIRQMWMYHNMGTLDCVGDQGHIYMFGEDIAKRDIDAVSSCLHTCFKENRSGAR